MNHSCWMHVQWSTYGTWLPGDPRGFRNRAHRVHSTGTYKNPPPPGEHAGLLEHARGQLQRPPVCLEPHLRARVRDAIVEKARMMGMPLSTLAVSGEHVHALLFVAEATLDAEVGKLKRHSSHAIRDEIPGTVWGAGCHPLHVEDNDYFYRVHRYILDHAAEGAAVWRRPTAQEVWKAKNATPTDDPGSSR